MSDSKENEEVVTDTSNPDVVTKYRAAGDIANAALKAVAALCVVDAKLVDICIAGETIIEEALAKIYTGKKKVDKGIAFPVCVSVNNLIGHVSPLAADTTTLKEGDVCKIDLGVHVDGFIAVVADTLAVGGPAKGKAGDLLAAAFTATELAVRMVKAGNKNTAVTEMISKVAEDFKCNAVHGVLSHQMERFVIDGEKTIINKQDVDEKVDEIDFEEGEIYAVDIVLSTGEGKPKEVDDATTVYKKTDKTYQLKLNASRKLLSDVKSRFPTFPFTMRAITEKAANFAIRNCLQHELVIAYPVLSEKDGDLVAQVKFTVLVKSGVGIKIAGPALEPSMFETDKALPDEELKKVLLTSGAPKKKKKNNKKKKKPAAE